MLLLDKTDPGLTLRSVFGSSTKAAFRIRSGACSSLFQNQRLPEGYIHGDQVAPDSFGFLVIDLMRKTFGWKDELRECLCI